VADANRNNAAAGAPIAPKTAKTKLNATDMKQPAEDKIKNTNKKV